MTHTQINEMLLKDIRGSLKNITSIQDSDEIRNSINAINKEVDELEKHLSVISDTDFLGNTDHIPVSK